VLRQKHFTNEKNIQSLNIETERNHKAKCSKSGHSNKNLHTLEQSIITLSLPHSTTAGHARTNQSNEKHESYYKLSSQFSSLNNQKIGPHSHKNDEFIHKYNS
jgi:hypothetical protein